MAQDNPGGDVTGPRWSQALARRPGFVTDDTDAFFKNIYDTQADPNAYLQQQASSFRQAYGQNAPEDDASVFQMIAKGDAPTPKNAPPAQQWNAQPAPATPATGGTAPAGGDLFNLLMQRIQQPAAASPNDPTIRAQADAYSANQQRGVRNYLADLAENAGPYANLSGEARLATEHAAQASGSFEAELLGREQDSRRQEITESLQLYGSLMTEEQRQALQRELAMMDDRARTAERGQQNNQFYASLGQNNDQFLRELALRDNQFNADDEYRWVTLGL